MSHLEEGRDENMESREFITGFGTGPDWETFQRVWKRVMPDEKNSLIQVAPPPKGKENEDRPAGGRKTQTVQLEELLKQICAGVKRVEGVAGRTGALPVWSALYRQRAQNLRQLGALYFLRTGKRYTCPQMHSGERMEIDQMLRREYLWEERWVQYCAEWGKETPREEERRLSRELVQQAVQRQQRIRQALERLGG